MNICERVVELNMEPILKPYVDLPRMAETAQAMVRDALDAAGMEVESSDLTQIPKTTMQLEQEDAKKVLGLIDALEVVKFAVGGRGHGIADAELALGRRHAERALALAYRLDEWAG